MVVVVVIRKGYLCLQVCKSSVSDDIDAVVSN